MSNLDKALEWANGAGKEVDGEIWRDIPGYEGIYQVSDHRRVKSLSRMVQGRFGTRTHAGRILKQTDNGDGRLRVSLSSPNGKSKKQVHRLVLEAFVGPCPEGMECCHWDDNPQNNHLSNLRWDTRSANRIDRLRTGRDSNARKTHCLNGHILQDPNLMGWAKGIGRRQCLACDRARSKVRTSPELGQMFQEVSDSYYESIMGRSV